MSEAQYHVSDELKDRFPYRDPPFSQEVDPHQVSQAFGSRSIPKYAQLLHFQQLSDENRVRALKEVLELLSSQEKKKIAVQHNMVEACTELLSHANANIRREAAHVLAALAIDRDARIKIQSLSTLDKLNDLVADKAGRVVQAALLAAMKFSWFRDALELIIAKNIIISRAIEVLSTQTEAKTLDYAMEFFMNVCQQSDGAQRAVECQIVDRLDALLEQYESLLPNTLLSALFCCWNLAKEHQIKASEMNLIQRIVAVLSATVNKKLNLSNEDADEVMRVSTGALMALSINDEAKPGLVTHAVEALSACLYSENRSTKQNAITAINNACGAPNGLTRFTEEILSDTALVLEVFGPRAAPVLNDKLKSSHLDAQASALSATERLTESKDGVRSVIQCLNMIENLISLLENQPDQVRRILQNITEASDTGNQRVSRAFKSLNISSEGIVRAKHVESTTDHLRTVSLT